MRARWSREDTFWVGLILVCAYLLGLGLALLLGLAAGLARLLGRPKPRDEDLTVTYPGPHGSESRVNYRALARLAQAKRTLDREGEA